MQRVACRRAFSVLARYKNLVAQGKLNFDAQQLRVVTHLDELDFTRSPALKPVEPAPQEVSAATGSGADASAAADAAPPPTESDTADSSLSSNSSAPTPVAAPASDSPAASPASAPASAPASLPTTAAAPRKRLPRAGSSAAAAKAAKATPVRTSPLTADDDMEPDTRTKKAMGAYIWGDVGSGKTMLMDLLYENAPAARKRRVHFHQFMIEAHARIHARNMEMLADKSLTGDAVLHVAAQIADEAHLLCFDELQITDICDAFIVSKMLAALWQRGTILIATSNRPPNDLYKDGLNRAYFVPFLRRLEKECAVLPILSGRDFRQDAVHVPGTYYAPASAANREQLWKRFVSESAANAAPEANTRVPVFLGRTLEVPFAAVVRSAHAPSSAATSMSTLSEVRACFADFRSLCDLELGAADYKGLAAHFKIVYVHGIPVMSVLKHDRARRFITLVDELYDAGVLLRWTADEAPARLFRSVSAAELIAEAIKQNDGSGGGGIGSFAPGLLGTDHAWNSPGGRLDERHVDNEKVNEVVEAVKRGGNGHVQPIALGTDHKWDDYGARLDERHVKNFMEIKDDPNRTSAAELPAAVPASKFAAPRSIDAAQEELKLLEGELASVQELRFAFKRAASRLTEMSGEQYLAAWQRRHGGGAAAVEAASPRPL